jgi:hypothetical protein
LLSSGEKYLFANRRRLSDIARVKLKKTKKIDVRLDQALFDLVDAHAQASRLSRGQVVERALLHLFGQTVTDTPIHQGKDPAQSPQIGPIPRKKKQATG